MAFTLFNDIQAAVLGPVTSAVNVSGQLVTWLAPFFLLGITIYIMVHGLEVVRGGGGSHPFLDALAKCAKPFLVLNLALAGGMYSSTVVSFFTELRTELSGLFGATGSNSYAALDAAVSGVIETIVKLVPEALDNISFIPADFSGVVMLFSMALIVLAFLFYAVVAAVNLLVIDASLSVVLGIGPLFVAALAFQVTAKFFDSWLSTVLKYVLTAVFLAMVIGIANGLIQKLAGNVGNKLGSAEYIYAAIVFVCSSALLVGLLTRASSIASDLVGGIALNLTGASQVAKAMAPAANVAGYAAGAAVGVAARGATATSGIAAGTSLGARVLKATESMRGSASTAASTAATGARNFGGAVMSREGVGGAFNVGRQAASSSAGKGIATGSSRPVPHIKD